MPETDDSPPLNVLAGIARRRATIQDASLNLLGLLESGDLEGNDREVGQLLAGCCFSLWRAAFLLDAKRSEEGILGRAKQFLRTVIQDNAVTYSTDRKNRDWSVGYYLNNARYRLMNVRNYEAYGDTVAEGQLADPGAGVSGMDKWDECFRVLELQLTRLIRGQPQPQQQQAPGVGNQPPQ